MMRGPLPTRHAAYGALVLLLAACDAPGESSLPGDGFVSDTTRDVVIPSEPSPILVAVDDQPLSQQATVYFDSTIQRMAFRVALADNTPATVTGVGWDRGPEGLPAKNRHLELTPINLITALPVELTTPQSELQFEVQLNTSWSQTSDLSPSVLVITTAFQDHLGVTKTHEFRLTLALSNFPMPQVDQSALQFRHVIGQQVFHTLKISQGPFEGRFKITDIRFERPSDELTLSDLELAKSQVIGLALSYISIVVNFRPQSSTLLDNALLIYTDASAEPLRVELTSLEPIVNHELTFSDPARFDFRGVTSTTTRSVTVTNIGTAPLTFFVPELNPQMATRTFWFYAYSIGTVYDIEVASWPQGLAPGRALRFDVTYTPYTGAPNSQLTLEYSTESLFGSQNIVFDLVHDAP